MLERDNDGPVFIELPNDNPDRIELLKLKQRDYQASLRKQKAENPFSSPELLPAWYAQRILGELLENGSVDTFELSRKINDEIGFGEQTLEYFENYCGVIGLYALGSKKIMFRNPEIFDQET